MQTRRENTPFQGPLGIFLPTPLSPAFLLRDLLLLLTPSSLSFQIMPTKGKGKISKQTNKLESIDSIAAAFNIGLLTPDSFLTCSVLMNSKQRKSKQTKNWGVYLVHLIYCFYWKEKFRLTWRHSPVQGQIYCRSNTRPDCLSLTCVRAKSPVWEPTELLKVHMECPMSITNNLPAGRLRTTTQKSRESSVPSSCVRKGSSGT